MPEPHAELTFVIPVKNGAAFVASTLEQVWAWLDDLGITAELLVVDDGSTDATANVLTDFATRAAGNDRITFRTLHNPQNRGKGYSLRRAFAAAHGEFVLFTDADLTYPIENAAELLTALRADADIAIGSRMHLDSRYVVAPTFFGKLFTRHFSGRVFNLLVRMLVVRGVRDSQAGLKGFRREAAQMLAARVGLDRFSFDVEMLFVAQRRGLRIDECPVLFVYRKEPSTVNFVRDSVTMIWDMLRIRWRGWRGVYDREADPAVLQTLRDDDAAATAMTGAATATRKHREAQGMGRTG